MEKMKQKIKEIIGRSRIWPREITTIREFIEKCSLSDFEKLKDMDWDDECDSGNE